MSTAETFYRIRRLLGQSGPRQTALRLWSHLRQRFVPVQYPVHPFDVQHGVDTSGLIGGPSLGSGHAHDRHITAYWGVAPSVFRHSMARWLETIEDGAHGCGDYVFVDLGCGKGRAVMLASTLPFHRVLGVELNPALASIAQTNLAIWRSSAHACDDISVYLADALQFVLPDEPILLYLYNPFDRHLTQLLLDRLQSLSASRSEPIDIVYVTPEHGDLFANCPGLQQVCVENASLTPEETAVDVFQTPALEYRIYRLAVL